MSTATEFTGLEIAVIGMAGRFPSARSVAALWKKLVRGEECISFFTNEELLAEGIDPALLNDPGFVKAAGVVDEADCFDASFFNYSPREAALLDPQQRLFLETAWSALEDAGYAPGTFRGAVGVYGGVGLNDYLRCHVPGGRSATLEHHAAVANDKDFLATRVSYKLNLEGPSVVVQSACSTSLVAIHLASQALIAGECDLALAGGVTIRLPQKAGYLFQPEGMSSPDGHCRAFSARAEGCLPGNGTAIVVLKRLSDALKDRDSIHAVIRGSAVNNDGAAKVGYTAPRADGQARVIRSALQAADVSAATIGYLEAHGTGTALGDPIEIQAATQAYRQDTDARQFCAIGTVKSNLGHLDAAAGVTGFIKAVLAVKHGVIPPTLHCEATNPRIDFDGSPFFVNTNLRAWPDVVRRAGVSSFGVGGTNAHVVLEQPPTVASSQQRPQELVVVSAKTPAGLARSIANLGAHLREHRESGLSDVAFTLRNGRAAFRHRRAFVCNGIDDAVSQLARATEAEPPRPAGSPRLVFMFPGQGSQYVGMCRDLYLTEPTFRRDIEHAAALLQPLAGFDLRDVVCPSDEAQTALVDTRIAQPSIFVVSWALSRLLLRWGFSPAAMIGHSIGEYVAACLSGVFTFEDGLRLVATRGRLMGSVAPGAMLAVPLDGQELLAMLPPDLAVAARNAPGMTIVSGPIAAVQSFAQALRTRGVEPRALHTSHAFHSAMMDPVLDGFAAALRRISFKPASIPFVSNVTGTWIRAEEATSPEYWVRHLRDTVRFSEGITNVLSDGDAVLLEVGPGQSLTSLARRHRRADGTIPLVFPTTPHADRKEPDERVLLEALGGAWAAGYDVEWGQYDSGTDARRVSLPCYPFERDRHWIDPVSPVVSNGTGKRPEVRDWFSVPTWERLPECLEQRPGAPVPGERWAVFADEYGFGREIGARLAAAGHDVTIVRMGCRFERPEDRVTRIDPRCAGDYQRLCAALSEGARSIRVVHCWTAEPDSGVQPDPDDVQDRGFHSLLFLTQSLGAQQGLTSCQLTIVTTGTHEVTGTETLCPAKATAVAFCRTIPLEYPDFRCAHLDVVLPANGGVSEVVDQTLACLDDPTFQDSVALRGRFRWRQTLAPVALHSPEHVAALKQRGVYLVVGGTGGVGLAVAEHLAKTVQARVALVSRTPPSSGSGTRLGQTVCDDAIARLAEQDDVLEEKHRASLPMVREAGLEATLDRLCVAQILSVIQQAGIDISSSDGVGREELKARCRIAPQFERLFSRLLQALQEAGLAALDGPAVRFTAAAAQWPPASALCREAAAGYPHMTAVFDLLEHCGRQYPQILCGETPALGALFGEGSDLFTRATATIREHSDIPVCQALVGELFSQLLGAPRTGALRVLEVGAGEGILTRALMPLCDARNVEYHFTDIGRSFVVAAQREAVGRGTDFMRFGVLDISRPAAPQGFSKGAYDVVLAFNVLHATRNVSDSLLNAGELLAPGGLLVVQESVRPRLWIDFIWGLTDGWWAFDDDRRRHLSSPLMPVDSWVEALGAAGFESITPLPAESGKRAQADTAVVIARKPMTATVHPCDGAPAAIEALERSGAEVMVVAADVADRVQMRGAIDRIVERFGPIDGVIHAALVLEDGTIQAKTRDSARRVLAPKVAGTLVLEEILAGRPLDFFVMFSSLVAQMGGAGQIDYCAASNFQDAFAHANRSRLAKAVISIDWGAWREVGKAFRSAVERGIPPGEALPDGMSPADGLDAFMRVLACPYPQVVASPQDPAALRNARATAAGGRAAASGTGLPLAASATDTVPRAGVPRNDTERVIADLWRDVLGVERIGIEDNFFDLGADSVISLQFIAKARKAGLRFTNQQVFEHQTVAGLAAAAANGHRDAASKGREL